MDGQAGESAITVGEFSIHFRFWADFLQKALWPDLKMRKSLGTHTHSLSHTHIAGDHFIPGKKKRRKKQLIHNCKCHSLCVETVRFAVDGERGRRICCVFLSSLSASEFSLEERAAAWRVGRFSLCSVPGREAATGGGEEANAHEQVTAKGAWGSVSLGTLGDGTERALELCLPGHRHGAAVLPARGQGLLPGASAPRHFPPDPPPG